MPTCCAASATGSDPCCDGTATSITASTKRTSGSGGPPRPLPLLEDEPAHVAGARALHGDDPRQRGALGRSVAHGGGAREAHEEGHEQHPEHDGGEEQQQDHRTSWVPSGGS